MALFSMTDITIGLLLALVLVNYQLSRSILWPAR
jgi:hypothetical protein